MTDIVSVMVGDTFCTAKHIKNYHESILNVYINNTELFHKCDNCYHILLLETRKSRYIQINIRRDCDNKKLKLALDFSTD